MNLKVRTSLKLKNENLEICFKAFDSDNSGKISLDEISAIFSNGDKEKMNKEEIEALKKIKNLD